MKIAIACSGLGHVQRGIEAWARDTAAAVSRLSNGSDEDSLTPVPPGTRAPEDAEKREMGRGDACLSSGDEIQGRVISGVNHERIEVTLYSGAEMEESKVQGGCKEPDVEQPTTNNSTTPVPDPTEAGTVRGAAQQPLTVKVLPCLKRGAPLARLLAKVAPPPAWRWGWKSAYGIEQYTFAKSLIRELQRHPVDIVHTQDVIVAQMLEAARKKGLITAKMILAHGTEESIECLAQFEYLQELSPSYAARHDRHVFMIPNFVSTDTFRPEEDSDRMDRMKTEWGIPEESFVIGCVAAVKKGHKRIDYLLREFAEFQKSLAQRNTEGDGECLQEGHRHAECRRKGSGRGGDASSSRGRKQVAVAQGGEEKRGFTAENTPASEPQSRHDAGQAPGAEKSNQNRDAEGINSPQGTQRTQRGGPSHPTGRSADSCAETQSSGRVAMGEHGNSTTSNQTTQQPFLLIAGAKTEESDELVRLADDLAPGRVKFLFDLPRDDMPDVYRAMDLYVHPADKEIFGICLLEAMACGVPVVAHNSEVLKWVVGVEQRAWSMEHGVEDGGAAGGWCVDVTKEGFLAKTIEECFTPASPEARGPEPAEERARGGADLDEESSSGRVAIGEDKERASLNPATSNSATQQLCAMRARARRHVVEHFSSEAVVPQMVEMYREVLAGSGRQGSRKYKVQSERGVEIE